jgi:hypothetical protein
MGAAYNYLATRRAHAYMAHRLGLRSITDSTLAPGQTFRTGLLVFLSRKAGAGH